MAQKEKRTVMCSIDADIELEVVGEFLNNCGCFIWNMSNRLMFNEFPEFSSPITNEIDLERVVRVIKKALEFMKLFKETKEFKEYKEDGKIVKERDMTSIIY